MDNMVANAFAKSSYDRLRIDKALGFWNSDNNDDDDKKSKNVRSDWDPLPGPKKH